MCSKEDSVQPKINKFKKKKEGWEGQRQRETGDAALLAVRMEEGPRAREVVPLAAGKDKEAGSPPDPSERKSVLPIP